MEYNVDLVWDNDAAVWVATSNDVRGLVLESGSVDALIEKVRFALPEILAMNKQPISESITVCFRSERHEQVYA